ncbi:MAG: putative Ig domain-containing protein, partial [Marinoscillum sp.]
MRQIIFAGWFWLLSMHLVHGQTNIAPVPDQAIGRGGDFTDINLNGYALSDVVWQVGFLVPDNVGNAPAWQVSTSDFQFEMNVTAEVYSKGQSADEDTHILAVKDAQGAIRGVASALEVQDKWVYFLTVYGNTSGEELQYVFYDSQYGEELYGGKVQFVPNGVIGQPDDPHVLTAEILALELQGAVLNIKLSDPGFIGTERVLLQAHSVVEPGKVSYDTLLLSVIDDYEPGIDGIPDQVVAFGEPFLEIDLANFVTLKDGDDVEYLASTNDLTVTISGSVASVTYPENWFGTDTVTFSVTDMTEAGFSDSDVVLFIVLPEEQAPIVAGIPDQRVGLGGVSTDLNLNDYLSTNNPDGIVWSVTPYSSSAESTPEWNITPANFEFNMSATCSVSSFGQTSKGAGDVLAVFSQSDSTLLGETTALKVEGDWFFFLTIYSNSGEEEVFFRFYDADLQRVLSIREQITFSPNAVLGDPLEPVVLTAGPIIPQISGDVASFEFIDEDWAGVESFVFAATDTTTREQLFGTDTMQIEVIDVSSPTLVTIPPQEIAEGSAFVSMNLTDYLGGVAVDMATFTISGADTLNPVLSNGVVSFTMPNGDYFGESVLTVRVNHKDFPELSATGKVLLTVSNVNDAPIISSSPDTVAKVSQLYQYEINGYDIDNTAIVLTVISKPDWLVFVSNGGFGLLFGTPTPEDEGTSTITLELTDGELVTTQEFDLTVSY